MAKTMKKAAKKSAIGKYKAHFAVGVTIQLDEYEPIKLYSSSEVEHDGSDPDGVNLDLATRVMKRLDDMTSEVALKIAEIKAQAIEDLSDTGD